MNSRFTFKQFEIQQDRCAMKVGTDGVLVGAWARGGHRILDIGCGTGLIALMMAQRYPHAYVDGVEIDLEAARQATENVIASAFANRIGIHALPLQEFVPSRPYDAMVSNPPFFLNGLKNPDISRTLARHAESLPYKVIFTFAGKWLNPDGELSVIIPVELLEQFTMDAYMSGFCVSRRVMIRTTLDKLPKRCLIAFSKQRKGEMYTAEQYLTAQDGGRSEWYANLTKDFYIR
jgi:tRNA1Val (adenine37-N6)-methyltransferase